MASISLSITFLSYVHCSNIHSSAAYWVFVSQLIAFRMNRQPFNKQVDKQDYQQSGLKSAICMFYYRHNAFISKNNHPLGRMQTDVYHINCQTKIYLQISLDLTKACAVLKTCFKNQDTVNYESNFGHFWHSTTVEILVIKISLMNL